MLVAQPVATEAAATVIRRSRKATILMLTGPAYLWLTLTIFLPLCAMLYYSFLSDVPFGDRSAVLTLENYAAFFQKDFYQTLMLRSFKLGFEVTFYCLVFGFPCAYVLAKTIKGRWREALFLLIILPFWSNALVRIFSWTMVLRGNGVLEYAINWIIPGLCSLNLLFTYPAIAMGQIVGLPFG